MDLIRVLALGQGKARRGREGESLPRAKILCQRPTGDAFAAGDLLLSAWKQDIWTEGQ